MSISNGRHLDLMLYNLSIIDYSYKFNLQLVYDEWTRRTTISFGNSHISLQINNRFSVYFLLTSSYLK